MRPTTIYALCHPETYEVRYIGKTVDLLGRYSNHCCFEGGSGPHANAWVKSFRPLKPIMIELETVEDDWIEAEMFWIAYMRSLGARLTNHTLGGEGALGFKHSPECLAILSEIAKNRSPEYKANMSIAQKDKKLSLETRAKISETLRNLPPEIRFKMSEASRANNRTPEHKAKLSASSKNSTPEHRAKISIAMTGRIVSEETRAKQSASLTGRVFTEEHRNGLSSWIRTSEYKTKLSVAAKAKWQDPIYREMMAKARKAKRKE